MAEVRKAQESSEWVEIRNSKIHQRGLFAKKDIPEGTRIIQYVGDKITKAESERRGVVHHEKGMIRGDGTVYIFTLNDRYDIDGDVPWNDARFANHSCDPNAHSDIFDHSIWLIADRDIEKNEEIVYDYNFDAASYKEHPCRCGSEKCLGYMVGAEYRSKLKKLLKTREKGKQAGHQKRKKQNAGGTA